MKVVRSQGIDLTNKLNQANFFAKLVKTAES